MPAASIQFSQGLTTTPAGQSALGYSTGLQVTFTDAAGGGVGVTWQWSIVGFPGPLSSPPTINSATSQTANINSPTLDGVYVIKLVRTDPGPVVTTDVKFFAIGDTDYGFVLPSAGMTGAMTNVGGSSVAQNAGWEGTASAATNVFLDGLLRFLRSTAGRFVGSQATVNFSSASPSTVTINDGVDKPWRILNLTGTGLYTEQLANVGGGPVIGKRFLYQVVISSTSGGFHLLNGVAGPTLISLVAPASGSKIYNIEVAFDGTNWRVLANDVQQAGFGSAGQILATNASANQNVWVTISGDASSSASIPGQLTVTGLQGRPVSATAPTNNYVLGWSSGTWGPTDPSTLTAGSVTPGTAGQIYITNSTPAATWTTLSGDAALSAAGAIALQSAVGNVTLEKYGAIGDGVTDDHLAYTNALASGKSIWLGSKTYLTPGYSGTLAVAGQSLIGSGGLSRLQNLTNQPIVTIGADEVQVSAMYLYGTFGAGTSNHGVDIQSFSKSIVSNIYVFEPGGSGVHYTTGNVANMGPVIMGLRSFDAVNGAGFHAALGEYAVLVGASLYGGKYGVHNDGGNNIFVGVHADLNDTGILVDNNDGNDGHGIVVGSSFNHNTTWAADVKPLINGFNFHASHFYYAALRVVGTDGTHLTPSLVSFFQDNIDVTGLTLTNALVQFDGNVWPMANANTITNTGSTIIARPNNMKLDGTPFDFGVDYRWDMAATRSLNYNWAGTTQAHFDSTGRLYAGQGTTAAATVIGPTPGFTSSSTGMWGLGTSFDCGVTLTASNYFISTDGANTYINSPHHLGFGTIQFYAVNSTLMAKLDPVANKTTFYQNILANTLTGTGTGYIQLDASGNFSRVSTVPSGSVAPGTAGQIFVTDGTPAAVWTSAVTVNTTTTVGSTTFGGVGASDYRAVLGPLIGNATSGVQLHMLPHGTAESATNYIILTTSTAVKHSVPNSSGSWSVVVNNGSTYFNIDGTAQSVTLSPGGLNVVVTTSSAVTLQKPVTISGSNNLTINNLSGTGTGYATLDPSGVVGRSATIPSGGITPGTAGQIFITDGTPAAVWTSLISVDMTTGRFTVAGAGTDAEAILGPLDTVETTHAALWLLPHGGSRTFNTRVLNSDGSLVTLNAPSATALINFAGGGTVVGSIETAHGRITSGGSGSDFKAILGPLVGSETTAAALYLLPTATAASGSNYSLAANTSSLYLIAPGPGTGAIRTTSSGLVLGDNSGGALTINVNSGAGTNLEFAAGVTPSIVQDAAGSDVAAKSLTLSAQAPFSTAVTNLTAGDVIVNTAASVGAGTKQGGFQVQYAGIAQVRLGAYSNGGTYSAVWLHDGGTPTTSNYVLLSSGASGYTALNAPSGILHFAINNSDYMTLSSAALTMTAPLIQWSATVNTPSVLQSAAISDVVTNNLMIQAQGPYSAAVTNLTAGDVIINVPPSVGAGSKYGGLMVRAGTGSPKNMVEIGPYAFGTANPADGAIWFSTATPGAANFSFLGDGTNSVVNSPSGFLSLRVANTSYVNLTSTSMTVNASTFGIYNSAGSFGFQLFAGAAWLATWAAASTSVGFTHTAAASDVATANITIQAQAPFSTAVTNLLAGDIIINTPASTGAGIKYGGLQVQYNGAHSMYLGTYNNASGGGSAMWNNVTPTTNNFTLYGDGTNTILNSNSSLYLRIANANTELFATTNGIQLFSAATAFGGGTGVLGIADAATPPTTAPTSGHVVYGQSGRHHTVSVSGHIFIAPG